VYYSQGSLNSLVYFALAGSLDTCLGRLPGGEYTEESQLPGDEYTGESRLPGDEYTEESRLPGSEYTGESITNSNNSSNIRKNSKFCLAVFNGTRRSCLMKKTRVKKSRDTVPLKAEMVKYYLICGCVQAGCISTLGQVLKNAVSHTKYARSRILHSCTVEFTLVVGLHILANVFKIIFLHHFVRHVRDGKKWNYICVYMSVRMLM
jgi:hypothetical protein